MNKICFNQFDEIIGFNLCSCSNFINMENVNDINKTIYEEINEEKLDTLGRRVFIKKHKFSKKSTKVSSMEIDNFEDDDFIYEKQYNVIKKPKITYLISESKNFTIEDILEEKKKQLIEKFDANDCMLFETFENETFNNDLSTNCVIGKTFLTLNSQSEINVQDINLSKHSQILIYCESDNEVDIMIKDNIITQNEYFKHSAKTLNFKINSKEKTNIYCIAILIK